MPHDISETGVYAPIYYELFKCTADKCRNNCCVDWEVCIDERTLKAYRKIPEIYKTVAKDADGACFVLDAENRCPHLREDGLCRIILEHGEGLLCDICRNHPRFFHDVGTRREVGLGLACEEACRLILECKTPFLPVKIGEIADSVAAFGSFEPPRDRISEALETPWEQEEIFDPLPERDRILETLLMPSSLAKKITVLQNTFHIPKWIPETWLDLLLGLEMLHPSWALLLRATREIPATPPEPAEYEPYYTRLCAYFVYRHVSVADSPLNLRARLALALLSTQIIQLLFERSPAPSREVLFDLARRYSAEIEYSEENTEALIFELECRLS